MIACVFSSDSANIPSKFICQTSMLSRERKLRLWLIAGYMLGVILTIYPAYLLHQVMVSPDKKNATTIFSKTRLAELDQQLELVSLQIHRLQAELVLGRKLYRLTSLNDKKTTYLGQVVINHDELLAILRGKWSRLQTNKTSRHILQIQKIQLLKQLNNTDSKALMVSIPAEPDSDNDDSLKHYLDKSDPDIYMYWPTRDAYFIMTTATASEPSQNEVTKFLQQTQLQQFIVGLVVNSQQRIIDKLQYQTNLTVILQEILQHYYFLDHWQTGNGSTAWLFRVNLEGRQGLSAALLPAELALLRNDPQPPQPIFANPSQHETTKTKHTAVIFDLRAESIKPGLFPRIITSSGVSVYSVSQTDPNKIPRKGAMVYSDSLATLQSMLGETMLLVTVQETRGPYGLDWVISKADASKISVANHAGGLFFDARIGAWLTDGYQ